MLLTDKNNNDILIAKSKEKAIEKYFKEVNTVYIYEWLNEFENKNDELAVSPLSYVALGCGR